MPEVQALLRIYNVAVLADDNFVGHFITPWGLLDMINVEARVMDLSGY